MKSKVRITKTLFQREKTGKASEVTEKVIEKLGGTGKQKDLAVTT